MANIAEHTFVDLYYHRSFVLTSIIWQFPLTGKDALPHIWHIIKLPTSCGWAASFFISESCQHPLDLSARWLYKKRFTWRALCLNAVVSLGGVLMYTVCLTMDVDWKFEKYTILPHPQAERWICIHRPSRDCWNRNGHAWLSKNTCLPMDMSRDSRWWQTTLHPSTRTGGWKSNDWGALAANLHFWTRWWMYIHGHQWLRA